MNLRLPPSGSLLESLLNHLGTAPNDPSGDLTLEGVTEAHLVDALDALERGDVEYAILEHGDEFLQAAGTDDGAVRTAGWFNRDRDDVRGARRRGQDDDASSAAQLSRRRRRVARLARVDADGGEVTHRATGNPATCFGNHSSSASK